jgi:DNA polymerase III subunit delta'
MAIDPKSQASGWPVIGHDHAISMLKSSIRRDLLSHAYLITGPAGVGKRTLALALAMTLNCQAEVEADSASSIVHPSQAQYPSSIVLSPCGLCSSCSRTRRGEHPDVLEVDLETQAELLDEGGRGKSGPAKELKIDTIRELQRTVGLSPYSGRWKIYIIGDAERLNDEAANCLLKTLEEPPAQTMLVMLAPDETSVLPTISSRCAHISLRPLPRDLVRASLVEHWGADPEQATQLAALSGGRLGWAVSMLQDRNGLALRSAALQDMAALSGSPISDRINAATRYAKKFTDARPELYATLDIWEGWWRDVIVANAAASDLVMNVDQLPTLTSIARRVPVERAHAAIELIQATRRQLQENVNPRLALEALTLGLP